MSGCGTRRATSRAPAALAPVIAPPPPPTRVEQTPHSTAPLARGWGRGAPARSGATTRGAPRTAPVSAGREGHRAAGPAERGSRQLARSLRRATHRLCLWPVLAKCLLSPHLRRFAGAFIGVGWFPARLGYAEASPRTLTRAGPCLGQHRSREQNGAAALPNRLEKCRAEQGLPIPRQARPRSAVCPGPDAVHRDMLPHQHSGNEQQRERNCKRETTTVLYLVGVGSELYFKFN